MPEKLRKMSCRRTQSDNGWHTGMPLPMRSSVHRYGLRAALLTALITFSGFVLSGCGGGGGNGQSTGSTAVSAYTSEQLYTSSFLTVTSPDYQLVTPTFYYSTINDSFWSIQANMAKTLLDPDTRCVIRIDVPKIDGSLPHLNRKFSLEGASGLDTFPGMILVFNGSLTTLNRVEQGTIAFAPDSATSGQVNGSYDVIMTEYGPESMPHPTHHLTGTFSFRMGDYGPADPRITRTTGNAP